MTYPRLEIDINKIRYNTSRMVGECNKRGISVAGVTKVFCGNERIAEALVSGGVDILADSRIENLKKLSKFKIPKMLIRIPMLSQVKEVVKYAHTSLVSELTTIKELSNQAINQNKIHNIILMIDLGDLREGVFYENEISEMVREILLLKGVKLIGIGTNLTCYGAVIPTKENLSKLIKIKKKIEDEFGINLNVVSGGNSGSISLFKNNEIPKEINQLRLGASLSLGIGLNDDPIKGLFNDAFKLVGEIVKIKKKNERKNNNIKKRAVCAVGRQEIDPNNLIPCDKSISILDSNDDVLILDITESEKNYYIGDKIEFDLTYGGCLSTMTSEYVCKVYI